MATPIKDTPILYGKDAKRFREEMRKAETEKAPKEEREKIQAIYNKMKDKFYKCD